MTIYAIVDDFLSNTPSHGISGPVWTLLSPAAILQGGNPYFVPDFSSRFEARTALAVRIGKLGKGIAQRFVRRYVDAVAPAVVFVAADRLDSMRASGLPWTSAISYDRSLSIGRFGKLEFNEIPKCECSIIIESADAVFESKYTPCKSEGQLEETIEAISRDNTIKTGDILLIGLSDTGPEVNPNCRLRLLINGEESVRFNIR